MMGVQEFNSSCFYRYAVLDLGQLVKNLGDDHDLARTATLAFVQASLRTIPTGKRTWTAPHSPPLYMRLVVRDGGAPQSLANAFLAPARPTEDKDLGLVSVEKLEAHADALGKMYGNGGACLLRRSSVYEAHSDGSVEDLVRALDAALRKACEGGKP
jgi:CRISPR system Cascade subunit CasC